MNLSLEQQAILSNYEHLTPLDSNSRVWLVRDIRNSELYVKKTVTCDSPEIYLRLQSANVDGIPQIFHVFGNDGEVVLIEEYIHGETADKYIQSSQDKTASVRKIAVDLCHILSNLHQLSPAIICRDIKPSNIMVEHDKAYIVDFNIARSYDLSRNEDTRLLGTAAYAAPEQYGFGQTDARTDIYSLGVTINYLMTGQFPKDELAPAPYGPIIAKATSIDPEDRYQSALDFADALSGANEPGQSSDNADRSNRKFDNSDKSNLKSDNSGRGIKRLKRPATYIAIAFFITWGYYLFEYVEFTTVDGTPETPLNDFVASLFFFLILFLPYLYNGNYWGLLDKTVNKYRNNKLKYWIMRIVFTLLAASVIPIALVIFTF